MELLEVQKIAFIKPSKSKERGSWANKTEFLLSCMGYAIGIGNIWRFPYLCFRNGGGAFLIPYLLMLLFCGIPLFFMEICLGQFANTGCITLFKISPLFKGTGYAIIVVNVLCTLYYNVVISYPILFLIKSMQFPLPWENCNNSWNSPLCFDLTTSSKNLSVLYNSEQRTPADEFFHNEILQISSGIDDIGGIVWPLFWVNIVSWIIIFCCIINGIKSIGKVVYFTATFPFLVLGVLFFRGITLPGAIEGIKYYITPKWDELFYLKVWADAAVQIFYSLGPGWGGIINMASYNNFNNNAKWDSVLIPIINCGTSIFAGFVVFSVLGYMSHQTGVPVANVAKSGPQLAFVTYPEAIAMLPFPQFWSVLFFSMLYFLGMDSCFVQIEAVVSAIIDEYPQLRSYKKRTLFVCCFIMFLGSLFFVTNGGMYLLQLFDWYAASISVILICFIELVIVGWIYGVDNFVRDIEFMIKQKVNRCWTIIWKYITPTILAFIFVTTILYNTDITYNSIPYPKWSVYLGWSTCLTSIVCIPIYMVYLVLKTKTSFIKRFTVNLKPNDWRPSDPDTYNEWKEYCAQDNKSFA